MKKPTPDSVKAALRRLPAISVLLESEEIGSLTARYPRPVVLAIARQEIERLRREIIEGTIEAGSGRISLSGIIEKISDLVASDARCSIRRAVNATGVLLHTGLGRSPLAPAAQEALKEAAARYATLAVDMETGTRGDRYSHVVDLLRDLTGAEAALVVNNNAAAVLLALNTLAEGREAIVSRGELVEIGGMFRIPDVMLRAGVKMVEIGTTNRTHLADYRRALTDQTGLIAKIHPSNYRIEGFYREATVEELGRLAAEHNVPLFYDIGSGSLVDLARWGLPSEPTVQSAIQQGANLVVFSGDKLIGGPQCGMIVGKEELVSRCKRNPLVRALRPDKLTLAALQATLKLFRDPDGLPAVHPLYAMLAATVEQLNRKALNLKRKLVRSIGARGEVRIKTGFSVMGSGALPARNIPTVMVTLSMNEIGAQELGRLLRNGNPPIFTRIEDDLTCFDMRTIADDEIKLIADAVDRLGNND